jgi:hypothetical protein
MPELLGIRPAVFITLYNAVNGDSFAAARENGIRYISANVTSDRPPYDIYEDQSLYRLPEMSLMRDLDDDTRWLSFAHQAVLLQAS